MEGDFPLLPSQRGYQYAYELAYCLACDELTRLSDIEGQCRRSGAGCYLEGSKRVITLEYLNEPYQINLPDVEVSRPGDSKPVPLRDKLLILHYFIRAKGSPLSHRIITFKELARTCFYPAAAHELQRCRKIIAVRERTQDCKLGECYSGKIKGL